MPGLTKNMQDTMGKHITTGEWIEGEKVIGLWPDVDVQMFLSSGSQRKSFDDSCASGDLMVFQLSRVWIYIGDEKPSATSKSRKISLHAIISSNEGGNEKDFSHNFKPVLPNGNFFCLCLPRVFPNEEKQQKTNPTSSISKSVETSLVLKRGLLRLIEV
eukprot:CAMPEP_0204842496 /NCGR_PEP_ID=MMETSP1346-20131115/46651_1 /ASSEMBLY_ACC=CAM_ASM_000771 /TAXON_ID=215587 /ORGANISM="Aplanochytrium stocchinoi, Strain GSBS06" /LENGTH=158 /DNA_ID=CAMNT_0051981361 /DNA_START=72 /DNA_END=548 /DNA_ORIENTATION=+